MPSFYSELVALSFPRPTSGPFTFIWAGPHDYEKYYLVVNGIKRCDSDRLIFLLTYVQPPPLLTKQGKPRVHQPPPHKDETGRFYDAQCCHYGLRPKSNKTAAKNALLALANVNNGELTVPSEVTAVEERLAKEFKALKVEYDAKVSDIKAREQKAGEEVRRKRKREMKKLLHVLVKKPKRSEQVVSARNACYTSLFTLLGIGLLILVTPGLSNNPGQWSSIQYHST
jgi:hypothetical protein